MQCLADPSTDHRVTDTYAPGSAEDFDRLYRDAYPRLKRTLTAVLGDPDAAEDCVQDAFVRAFKAWGRWRPEAPAEVWLHRIALNRALSYRRRRALHEIGEVLRRLGRPSSEERDPADGVAWMELKRAMRRLPARLSATIVLRHYHGYSNREIAQVFGISERAVSLRLEDARRRLQHLLTPHDKHALPVLEGTRVVSGEGF